MPISIAEVAARAGVSQGTVSKVLNGKVAAQIAPATQERVRTAASELGYHPSAIARGLAGKRLDTLGIVFAQGNTFFATSPYFAAILDGILEVVTRAKQNTMLFTGQVWSDARQGLPILRDGRCDGLLLISPPVESDIIPALLEAKLPFVLVGDTNPLPEVTSVDVDNVSGARTITEYLIGLGHRRIAYLCGPPTVSSVSQRLLGYREALAGGGIAFDPSLVAPGTYLQESGYASARELRCLPEPQRPTAFFCGNDLIAIGAMAALSDLGARVPRDVSVAGFDDIPSAATSQPPLTTMRQPMHLMGEHAAQRLLAVIKGTEAPGCKEVLQTELIVRGSTARLE